METLGKRLATIRAKRGLSQPDLAKLTGLRAQNICRMETEVRGSQVRSDTLKVLAQALDCSTDYLLGLTEDPAPARRRRVAKEVAA